VDEAGRAGAMAAVRELTDAVYPGLDVSLEIESVLAQGLGETANEPGYSTSDSFVIDDWR
jgi:hypothetical protein